jgi:hypothetical protein
VWESVQAAPEKEGGSSNSSKYEPQLTTVQLPNAGATTPPPPAMTATPNAPITDKSCKDLHNEPGLQGEFANGRDGKSIEQVDMIQKT